MTQSKNYRLTKAERKYLRTGETGSYSDPRMQERIQEKQDNIGSRFSTLIRDVSLMYGSEVYELNDKNDILGDFSFTGISRALDIGLSREDPTKKIIDRDRSERVRTPKTGEEFGFLLGAFLHMIFAMTSIDMLWKGTLRGLCHFYLTGTGEKPSNQLEDLKKLCRFERVEKIADETFSAEDISGDRIYITEFDGTPIKTTKDNVQEILENKNILSDDFLRNYLMRVDDSEEFESYWSYEKYISDSLSNLYDNKNFLPTIELYKSIMADKERLEEDFRGPDRLDILREMCRDISRIEASTIATNLDEASSSHLVSNGLKRMSDEVDKTERWTSYCVAKQYADGWKLTPYGRLLAMYVSKEITGSEIERYAVPDQDCVNERSEEIISEALTQISEN